MTDSYTLSDTTTFTITHARHIAAKVATDLKRMQRFYGKPSDSEIANYELEIIEFLAEGFLGTVAYGFHCNGKWIEPTLEYTAHDLAGLPAEDEDPGRIRPGADITGASFYSFLTYSDAWNYLSEDEKKKFRERLPFIRTGAEEPGVNGYFSNDRTYSAGGRALRRASVRSF